MKRLCLWAFLLGFSISAVAQPEARIYGDIFEKVGVGGGYSQKRWRFELTAGYRVDHVPAEDYLEQAHPWPSALLAQQARATFSDNTWQENTKTFTVRVIRTAEKERKSLNFYYGLYMRCKAMKAKPDTEDWSDSDEAFMQDNWAPSSAKTVDVFGGFLFGCRGTIKSNFFWDVNFGLKLIPWFYRYEQLSYNDGTADTESYQMAGYQYASPGETILQLGIGYKFIPRKENQAP